METSPEKKAIVISLGGSLVVPESIDTEFLKSFRELILSYTEKGFTFFLIVGGGKICRVYQKAAQELGIESNDTLDWIGIHSIQLNAEFVRTIFGDVVFEKVINDPNLIPETDKKVIVSGGWKPGWSTDYDAVFVALKLGAKKIINLSNIDYVYTDDPKKNPNATIIKDTTWTEFRKIIPEERIPGGNAPFDPIASKLADESGIEVAVMNGKNLENLQNYFDGKEFIGTRIHA